MRYVSNTCTIYNDFVFIEYYVDSYIPYIHCIQKDESVRERDFLKEKVRKMLDDEKKTYLDKLELIDDLQKLGVSYHFEREIENILTFFYQKYRIDKHEKDLHATALEFQLFRQHGFNVSEGYYHHTHPKKIISLTCCCMKIWS